MDVSKYYVLLNIYFNRVVLKTAIKSSSLSNPETDNTPSITQELMMRRFAPHH
ncbi:hypothetical protein [Pseudanabaena sp. SR411]|uniref:hypothetical protein n=1 Tax=Pseudanabaena sp. SR411 TaxID=1980935 RepID=UPI00159571B0|nr:hypothetical protein [Pseudanabaena sp. SR411]